MKLSEIQLSDAVAYMKLEEGQYDGLELQTMLEAAKATVRSKTGLAEKNLDNYEEISIACLALTQDFFENRSIEADKTTVSPVIDSILGMHRSNLLPKVKP